MKVTLYRTQFKNELDGYPGSGFEEVLKSLGLDEKQIEEISEIELDVEDYTSDYYEEPVIDDSVKFCPECETPNQFGELCHRCMSEMQYE